MLVPVAVLAILVIMGLASRSLFGTANRPVFLVLLILVLLVMSGLRSETVGMDTQRYYASFNDFLAMDREEAAEFISTQKDAGYYWFSWAFGNAVYARTDANPNEAACRGWIAQVICNFVGYLIK